LRHFIDDGYTLEGNALGLKFTYRPALAEEVQRYINAQSRTTDQAPLKAKVDLLMKHVQAWQAKGRDGADVPLRPESLHRLRYPVLDAMVAAVTGYGESGEDGADAGN